MLQKVNFEHKIQSFCKCTKDIRLLIENYWNNNNLELLKKEMDFDTKNQS